jgi:hypothetical protein
VADPSGRAPGPTAEKSLGEITSDISQKASLLVREEIELAKAEVAVKAKRLGGGAAIGAVGAVFGVLALIFFLHALAWLFYDIFFDGVSYVWVGFFITVGLLALFGGIAVLVAVRLIKRGSPPTPNLAIEEAKRTRAAIEEARH